MTKICFELTGAHQHLGKGRVYGLHVAFEIIFHLLGDPPATTLGISAVAAGVRAVITSAGLPENRQSVTSSWNSDEYTSASVSSAETLTPDTIKQNIVCVCVSCAYCILSVKIFILRSRPEA